MILGKSHPTLCLHISPCEEDTDLLWKASRRGRYCSWHRSRAEVFLEKQGWNWKGSYCCDRWLQTAVPSVQVPLRTANPGEAAVPLSDDGCPVYSSSAVCSHLLCHGCARSSLAGCFPPWPAATPLRGAGGHVELGHAASCSQGTVVC